MLKAIINQTRSIGNEFLVINIKADTEAGWHWGLCDQGCTRAFSACRTQVLTSALSEKRNATTALAPVWKWKLNKQQHEHRDNNNKNIARGLYFCLFIHKLTKSSAAMVLPLLSEKGLNFTLNSTGWNASLQLGLRARVTPLRLTATHSDRWLGAGESVFFKL